MSLQDSPTFDDNTIGQQKPSDSQKGGNRLRFAIGAILLLALVFIGGNLITNEQVDLLTHKGSIIGFAVDESENPIRVEVLVFGTDIKVLSNQNGYFEIDNVPAGEQSAIVAFDIIATEVKVIVESGKVSDLGTVEVPTEDLSLFMDDE